MKLSVYYKLRNALPMKVAGTRITLPFLHDITTTWNMADLDYKNPNEAPNLNLTILGLTLATNIETTIGDHAWSLVENSLLKLGFTNIVHHYFEIKERINHPAMVFARSKERVNGKYIVAAVFRGSASVADFISDAKAEPGGFDEAGNNAVGMLKAYLDDEKLTKKNTTLFITGHSYGAAISSLVAIRSTDLAERNSIFCYSFATPNYIRHGKTGDDMKMFCFASNEDIVPQVPVGPNLDKTGVVINYDRMDIQLRHPEQYKRFLHLYQYFRDMAYDRDSDFLPEEYSFKTPIRVPINNVVIRNHMPYTYMALILSELPDDAAYEYIADAEAYKLKELEMCVGEVYKLPASEACDCGGTLTWSSSDESVAPINEKGMLRGKKAGSSSLTVTAEDGRKAVIQVQVTAG